MAILIGRPVAVFKGKFVGVQPCKNPDYFNLAVQLEYDIPGDFRPEKHLQSAEDLSKVSGLEAGKYYYFKFAVGVNSGSERDGKKYPARVNLGIVEVKQAA